MANQILVLTHGTFSEGIKVSLRVITSEENAIDTMCVMEDTAPEKLLKDLREYMDRCDSKRPIILVTDIPFGSTTTLSAPLIGEYSNLHIVSGCNLGMLMGMVTTDLDDNTEEKLKKIAEDSKNLIMYINDRMK